MVGRGAFGHGSGGHGAVCAQGVVLRRCIGAVGALGTVTALASVAAAFTATAVATFAALAAFATRGACCVVAGGVEGGCIGCRRRVGAVAWQRSAALT